jgi:hypothetical protein
MFSPTPSVSHHEQTARRPHPECDEPLFARINFVIHDCNCVGIVKHWNRFWHTDAMFAKVDSGFTLFVPLQTHAFLVYAQDVHTSIVFFKSVANDKSEICQ